MDTPDTIDKTTAILNPQHLAQRLHETNMNALQQLSELGFQLAADEHIPYLHLKFRSKSTRQEDNISVIADAQLQYSGISILNKFHGERSSDIVQSSLQPRSQTTNKTVRYFLPANRDIPRKCREIFRKKSNGIAVLEKASCGYYDSPEKLDNSSDLEEIKRNDSISSIKEITNEPAIPREIDNKKQDANRDIVDGGESCVLNCDSTNGRLLDDSEVNATSHKNNCSRINSEEHEGNTNIGIQREKNEDINDADSHVMPEISQNVNGNVIGNVDNNKEIDPSTEEPASNSGNLIKAVSKKKKRKFLKNKVTSMSKVDRVASSDLLNKDVEKIRDSNVTRCGRLSKLPQHLSQNYDYPRNRTEILSITDAEKVDDTANSSTSKNKTEELQLLPQKPRAFKTTSRCPSCNKVFLGYPRMSRHFEKFPDHKDEQLLRQLFIQFLRNKDKQEIVPGIQHSIPDINKSTEQPTTMKGSNSHLKKVLGFKDPSRALKRVMTSCNNREIVKLLGPRLTKTLNAWDLLCMRAKQLTSEKLLFSQALLEQVSQILEQLKSCGNRLVKPLENGAQAPEYLISSDNILRYVLGLKPGLYMASNEFEWSQEKCILKQSAKNANVSNSTAKCTEIAVTASPIQNESMKIEDETKKVGVEENNKRKIIIPKRKKLGSKSKSLLSPNYEKVLDFCEDSSSTDSFENEFTKKINENPIVSDAIDDLNKNKMIDINISASPISNLKIRIESTENSGEVESNAPNKNDKTNVENSAITHLNGVKTTNEVADNIIIDKLTTNSDNYEDIISEQNKITESELIMIPDQAEIYTRNCDAISKNPVFENNFSADEISPRINGINNASRSHIDEALISMEINNYHNAPETSKFKDNHYASNGIQMPPVLNGLDNSSGLPIKNALISMEINNYPNVSETSKFHNDHSTTNGMQRSSVLNGLDNRSVLPMDDALISMEINDYLDASEKPLFNTNCSTNVIEISAFDNNHSTNDIKSPTNINRTNNECRSSIATPIDNNYRGISGISVFDNPCVKTCAFDNNHSTNDIKSPTNINRTNNEYRSSIATPIDNNYRGISGISVFDNPCVKTCAFDNKHVSNDIKTAVLNKKRVPNGIKIAVSSKKCVPNNITTTVFNKSHVPNNIKTAVFDRKHVPNYVKTSAINNNCAPNIITKSSNVIGKPRLQTTDVLVMPLQFNGLNKVRSVINENTNPSEYTANSKVIDLQINDHSNSSVMTKLDEGNGESNLLLHSTKQKVSKTKRKVVNKSKKNQEKILPKVKLDDFATCFGYRFPRNKTSNKTRSPNKGFDILTKSANRDNYLTSSVRPVNPTEHVSDKPESSKFESTNLTNYLTPCQTFIESQSSSNSLSSDFNESSNSSGIIQNYSDRHQSSPNMRRKTSCDDEFMSGNLANYLTPCVASLNVHRIALTSNNSLSEDFNNLPEQTVSLNNYLTNDQISVDLNEKKTNNASEFQSTSDFKNNLKPDQMSTNFLCNSGFTSSDILNYLTPSQTVIDSRQKKSNENQLGLQKFDLAPANSTEYRKQRPMGKDIIVENNDSSRELPNITKYLSTCQNSINFETNTTNGFGNHCQMQFTDQIHPFAKLSQRNDLRRNELNGRNFSNEIRAVDARMNGIADKNEIRNFADRLNNSNVPNLSPISIDTNVHEYPKTPTLTLADFSDESRDGICSGKPTEPENSTILHTPVLDRKDTTKKSFSHNKKKKQKSTKKVLEFENPPASGYITSDILPNFGNLDSNILTIEMVNEKIMPLDSPPTHHNNFDEDFTKKLLKTLGNPTIADFAKNVFPDITEEGNKNIDLSELLG